MLYQDKLGLYHEHRHFISSLIAMIKIKNGSNKLWAAACSSYESLTYNYTTHQCLTCALYLFFIRSNQMNSKEYILKFYSENNV